MTHNKYDRLGPLYAAIGHEVSRIAGGAAAPVFLYAEAGDAWAEAAVFAESPNALKFYAPDDDLFRAIMDAWNAEDPDKRWAAIELMVNGDAFSASFKFPEEIDQEIGSLDRRDIVLQNRFGDKKVDYGVPWD